MTWRCSKLGQSSQFRCKMWMEMVLVPHCTGCTMGQWWHLYWFISNKKKEEVSLSLRASGKKHEISQMKDHLQCMPLCLFFLPCYSSPQHLSSCLSFSLSFLQDHVLQSCGRAWHECMCVSFCNLNTKWWLSLITPHTVHSKRAEAGFTSIKIIRSACIFMK